MRRRRDERRTRVDAGKPRPATDGRRRGATVLVQPADVRATLPRGDRHDTAQVAAVSARAARATVAREHRRAGGGGGDPGRLRQCGQPPAALRGIRRDVADDVPTDVLRPRPDGAAGLTRVRLGNPPPASSPAPPALRTGTTASRRATRTLATTQS